MIRALGIVASIVALAVSAAPAVSASPKKPPPRGTWIGMHEYGHVNNINAAGGWDPTLRQRAITYNGHAGLGTNGVVTDNKDPDKLRTARNHGPGVIESVNVKYT